MRIHEPHPVRDEGTIVVFEGITEDHEVVWFGVDHHLAPTIILEEPESVFVEGWQILGRTEAAG